MGSISEVDNSLSRPVDEEEQKLLEELRARLKADPDLVAPTDDNFLLRFMRYRKHDIPGTLDAIRHKWRLAEKHPEVFTNIFETCMQHFPSKVYTVLKNRDPLGRQIVLIEVKNWDPSVPPMEMFKYQICITDLITSRQLTQLHGFIAIFDMEGLSMQQVKTVGPMVIKTLIQFLHGIPLKVKAFHVLNNPTILNSLWQAFKFFLKPKLKKRVIFHGYDATSLHDHVPSEYLPKRYGGLLEDDEFEEPNLKENITERREYSEEIMNLKKYGFRKK